MTDSDREKLQTIKTFPSLIKYLRDELDWPIEADDFDDLTFDYEPEELGIDAQTAAKIEYIKQLRPLEEGQPWGIFFVKFEPKRLPVVAMRRILRGLAVKKRASTKQADHAAWAKADLLFISAYGEDDERHINFAHFHENTENGDLPVLRVLGWDGSDTALHIDHVHDTLTSKLRWPDSAEDTNAWQETWSSAFTLRHREVITTSKQMAVRLADLAAGIRKKINSILAIEKDSGPMHKLMDGFREALIHDMKEDDFADMYAQTISYGLLTAAVSRTEPGEGTALVVTDVKDMVPTNPFLKELMETFLHLGGRQKKFDFDELGINDIVETLRSPDTHMDAVLRDFGDRNPAEDPVIHFYELFLKEYDAKKRMQRGVFYTPRPVVSYIVRSVHELLQTEFGLTDGLADTTTWAEMLKKYPEMKLPTSKVKKPDSPDLIDEPIDSTTSFVQILDPACGTGTFLIEVIDVIHKAMVAKWRKAGKTDLYDIPKLWNQYVPKHLLPRLHGYELLMAPYAIAHMKIGLKLFETGYKFASDERARIYLTNALEPPKDFSSTFEQMAPALAHEAQAVNNVKRHQRFTVVIGNPPYSYMSANLEDHHRKLVEPYKYVDGQRIRERGALQFELNLQDDYVKFIRLAEIISERSEIAIAGLVTNNSYLANVTFRGLRQHLTTTFSNGRFLNLHGSLKAGTDMGDDGRDKNVFDIQQGVSIALMIRNASEQSSSLVYGDLRGSRSYKYDQLLSSSNLLDKTLAPRSPDYLLVPRDETLALEYEGGRPIDDLFVLSSTGIMTNRDGLAISDRRDELLSRMNVFLDRNRNDDEVGEELGLSDNAIWSLTKARRKIDKEVWKRSIAQIDYRPFDRRFVVYNSAVVSNMRNPVMSQLDGLSNPCLLSCRQQIVPGFRHVFLTKNYFECCLVSLKSREKTSGFPLWRREQELLTGTKRTSNLSQVALAWFNVALPHTEKTNESTAAELAFYVFYAELHSPTYRERYSDFLQRAFPHVFPPASDDLFMTLFEQGRTLASLHLFESPLLEQSITTYSGPESPLVEKFRFTPEGQTIWLDKEQTRGFVGVPEDVWNFHIGGYQVCQKWLKDRQAKGGKNPRPGRVLTKDDIEHYCKIVTALHHTIRIMGEIDEVIEAHGGWPDAFITDAKVLDKLKSQKD